MIKVHPELQRQKLISMEQAVMLVAVDAAVGRQPVVEEHLRC